MRFANLAVVEKREQMRGSFRLSQVRPDRLNARIKCNGRAAESFEAHGAGEIEERSGAQRAMDRETTDGSHGLRSIQECKALFSFEVDGVKTALCEGL